MHGFCQMSHVPRCDPSHRDAAVLLRQCWDLIVCIFFLVEAPLEQWSKAHIYLCEVYRVVLGNFSNLFGGHASEAEHANLECQQSEGLLLKENILCNTWSVICCQLWELPSLARPSLRAVLIPMILNITINIILNDHQGPHNINVPVCHSLNILHPFFSQGGVGHHLGGQN